MEPVSPKPTVDILHLSGRGGLADAQNTHSCERPQGGNSFPEPPGQGFSKGGACGKFVVLFCCWQRMEFAGFTVEFSDELNSYGFPVQIVRGFCQHVLDYLWAAGVALVSTLFSEGVLSVEVIETLVQEVGHGHVGFLWHPLEIACVFNGVFEAFLKDPGSRTLDVAFLIDCSVRINEKACIKLLCMRFPLTLIRSSFFTQAIAMFLAVLEPAKFVRRPLDDGFRALAGAVDSELAGCGTVWPVQWWFVAVPFGRMRCRILKGCITMFVLVTHLLDIVWVAELIYSPSATSASCPTTSATKRGGCILLMRICLANSTSCPTNSAWRLGRLHLVDFEPYINLGVVPYDLGKEEGRLHLLMRICSAVSTSCPTTSTKRLGRLHFVDFESYGNLCVHVRLQQMFTIMFVTFWDAIWVVTNVFVTPSVGHSTALTSPILVAPSLFPSGVAGSGVSL